MCNYYRNQSLYLTTIYIFLFIKKSNLKSRIYLHAKLEKKTVHNQIGNKPTGKYILNVIITQQKYFQEQYNYFVMRI